MKYTHDDFEFATPRERELMTMVNSLNGALADIYKESSEISFEILVRQERCSHVGYPVIGGFPGNGEVHVSQCAGCKKMSVGIVGEAPTKPARLPLEDPLSDMFRGVQAKTKIGNPYY